MLHPRDPRVCKERADLEPRAGRGDEAIVCLREGIEASPTDGRRPRGGRSLFNHIFDNA